MQNPLEAPYAPIYPEDRPRFKRAFLAAPSHKSDPGLVEEIAEQLIYLSDSALHDTFVGTEFSYRFGHLIAKTLETFDPENDVLVYYGDQMIIAIAIFFLATRIDSIHVARWSHKSEEYVSRKIDISLFG